MVQTAAQNGWKETTLGDISKNIAYGYTESASLEKVGPKFLRITDIQDDFINWDKVPYCPINEANHKKYQLGIGDVVIARTGNSTGATAMIKQPVDAVFASYLIRFQIDSSKADYRFIDFLLRSNIWKNFVKSVKTGSAQGGANAKQFAGFPIFLPPLTTQHCIADILLSIDDKIELLNLQNRTLGALAQLVFNEWFVDFNFPNEGEKPYKKSSGKMIESALGKIPKGWLLGKLGDLVQHIKNGINPSNKAEETFYHYSIPAFDKGRTPVFEKGNIIMSNKYEVFDHSFLVSKLNPFTPRIWTVFSTAKNSVCSTEFQVLRSNKQEDFSFIHCFLNSARFTAELTTRVQGTSGSHQRVKPDDILNITLALPPDDILIKFHNIVFGVLMKIQTNTAQIQTLSTLRDKLLPKLMRGEIKVGKSAVYTLFTDDFPLINTDEELESAKKQYPNYHSYYVTTGCIKERRNYFEELWENFKPYADKKFLSEIKKQFHQRSWEMYMANIFLKQHISIANKKEKAQLMPFFAEDEGPDLILEKKIYIECVACEKGSKPDDSVPSFKYDFSVQSIPEDKMLLRITQVFVDKYKQYKKWAQERDFDKNKPFIIAINSGMLDFPQEYLGFPLIVKALFGLNNLAISRNGERSWTWQESISKKNGGNIRLQYFRDDKYKEISGVIFSPKTILNMDESGNNCFFINNPFAQNPVVEKYFSFMKQVKADKTKITKLY